MEYGKPSLRRQRPPWERNFRAACRPLERYLVDDLLDKDTRAHDGGPQSMT